MLSTTLKTVSLAALLATSAMIPVLAETPPPAAVPATMTAAKPDADMAEVLAVLAGLGGKPIETLEPGEARKQPTPTDAVMKIIKDRKLDVKPHEGLKVSNSRFADMGNLKLRWYVPESATKDSNLPIIMFFRGGGWVIADLDVYDATPAALARKTGAAVVSVDYPMGPENKFPAAHDEAIEAYKYVLKNAQGWGYDANRIALVGESAGGNLAINTAIAARDQNLTKPVAIVSIYPVATTSLDTPSKKEQAAAKPLNTPMMAWFVKHATKSEADAQDPRLNLVAADLKGLPPTTVINAEIDPLKSDGDVLVAKLKEAGVDTTHQLYTGVTHEFFGMDAVVAKAAEAQNFAVTRIKQGFDARK
ncbi:alpha/beta hydrolase [Bosea sp. (in: a-proteobacteria)]|uniref:alpha/beta hydrolase n=1 Tax=Bosea sp. (in: a-proteobacteria) TaxID=1871050 RepID=UPI00273628FA|nr:alpha/beta hydrolase [Bosea sp. (in: a-proteobacteria)]MDP3411451.1 alpha/beta hydrolase [Bosea sp. (in: a-proteobacteria)]